MDSWQEWWIAALCGFMVGAMTVGLIGMASACDNRESVWVDGRYAVSDDGGETYYTEGN